MQDKDVSVLIFMCKIFIESVANRAMHAFHDCTIQVVVSAHMKQEAPPSSRNMS